jgi:Tol biopolymer transport system component
MSSLLRLVASSILPALGAPLAAQTTTLVDISSQGGAPNGISAYPSLSGNGRFVAFESEASNLVANDNNSRADIFMRDMTNSSIVCVSVTPSGGNSNDTSMNPRISRDGRLVAFESLATNLVAGDTNQGRDVFVRDLVLNTTVRASVSSAGTQGNGDSRLGSISPDGRYVAFYSGSDNLVAGDVNGKGDVFLRDLVTGQTTLVSVTSAGLQGNDESDGGSVSENGHYVALWSWASNLVAGDTNGQPDVFVRDVWGGTTMRVSLTESGAQANGASLEARIAEGGQYVVFQSYATNLVTGDTNGLPDLFVRGVFSGPTVRVDVDSYGGQCTGQLGNIQSHLCGISANGRYTSFFSLYDGFVAGDTNNTADVFVHDSWTGATTRVSLGAGQTQANDASSDAAISFDGRFVAFGSYATNLDPNDSSTIQDVFLRDRGLQAATPFCFGDGTQPVPCPCANSGAPGSGCENSAGSGGALLWLTGFAEPDSTQLIVAGMTSNPLTVFLQGDVELAPAVHFGDGLRCAGGNLKRLYTKTGFGGSASVPGFGDLPLGLRSAALGDPLLPGASRCYQVYYRDSSAGFCPAPAGDLWNISNGVRVLW